MVALKWTVLLSLLPAFISATSLKAERAAGQPAGPTKLIPITINRPTTDDGLHRRASEKFADLDLQTQSELIYGSPGDNGQAIMANMILYAPDGLQMILLERFEGLTTAVDCHGEDGQMSLTFKSKQAFDYALKTWSFVNDKKETKFLLIANNEACSPSDQRKPYYITKVTQDAQKLVTYLAAQPAPWSEVAGSYELNFGRGATQPTPKASKRGLFSDIKGGLEDVGNAIKGGVDAVGDVITGSADLDKSVSFDTTAGTPGKVTELFKDPLGESTLDCINCFVQGSWEVTGHLNVHHFQLQELSIDAQPNNFLAELELRAIAKSHSYSTPITLSQTLLEAAIPGAGIDIPEIFSVGGKISYGVGVSADLKGDFEVDFGLKAQLPNTAKLTADVKNPSASSSQGFDGALTPLFNVDHAEANLTLAAYTAPKISFGLTVVDVAKFEVGLSLKLPQISATFGAEYDPKGVCTQGPGASKTGLKLSSQAAISLGLGITEGIGPVSKTIWSKTLWQIAKPLYSHCWPISIPGLGPVGGGGSSSLPSGVASPTGTVKPVPSGSGGLPAPSGTGVPPSRSGLPPSRSVSPPSPTGSGAPGPGNGNSTSTIVARRGQPMHPHFRASWQ